MCQVHYNTYEIKFNLMLMELILSQDTMQGACHVALDGEKIFIGGGRQLIDGSWVDYNTGIVV